MCTQLSSTASSRSTASKATQPSATLSESSPLIRFFLGLVPDFQSSKHQSRATSNRKCSLCPFKQQAGVMAADSQLAKVTP